jgi:hypothetical protein
LQRTRKKLINAHSLLLVYHPRLLGIVLSGGWRYPEICRRADACICGTSKYSAEFCRAKTPEGEGTPLDWIGSQKSGQRRQKNSGTFYIIGVSPTLAANEADSPQQRNAILYTQMFGIERLTPSFVRKTNFFT